MSIRFLAAALLAGVFLPVGAVAAAEIAAPSRIDGVTVYPGVATVTRVVEVVVPPGQHVLVVSGLPQALDPQSLRVEGVAAGELQIGSVEMRTQPLAAPPQTSEVAQRLRQLQEQKTRKQAEIQALTAKQAMISAIGTQAPTILGGKDKPVDPADWAKAWDAVGQGLRLVNEELTAANFAMRALDEEIAAIGRQGGVGPRAGVTRAASIAVEAAGEAKATLKLTYQVGGATWRPAYDAALIVGGPQAKPKLALVRRAVVSQRTGEDWTDVTIAVSTAQARGGTAAPEVPPLRVAFNEPPVVMQAPAPARSAGRLQGAFPPDEASRDRRQESLNEAAKAASPAPVAQQQAQVEVMGFSAQFVVPGRVTIAQDGSTRSFRLGSRELEPQLGVKAAPALDPKAYLEARFTNDEEAALLPGDVSLTRDGLYVGQGRIGQTAPGDEVTMGFGVDDRVKITRAPVRRRETEPGWVQGSRSDLREFRTVVKSLHDRPMRIAILDQAPFAENSAITVEPMANGTPPTERNLQDRRGVLAWTYDYKPGEEREIRHGYRIRWPGDRELVLEPQPLR
jgi:uncharacterized protein (TIGR02231 family)